MKHPYKFIFLLTVGLLTTQMSQAQLLKNLFNSDTVEKIVTDAVVGTSTLSAASLQGSWSYVGSACKFESDNLLQQAGGAVAATKVNEELDKVYSKLGFDKTGLTFTFNSDGTFSTQMFGKSVSGTYTVDAANSTIALSYKAASLVNLGTLTAEVEKLSTTLSLYFHADKLLSLTSKLAKLSQQSTIQTIGTLAESYDGLLLGYKLQAE